MSAANRMSGDGEEQLCWRHAIFSTVTTCPRALPTPPNAHINIAGGWFNLQHMEAIISDDRSPFSPFASKSPGCGNAALVYVEYQLLVAAHDRPHGAPCELADANGFGRKAIEGSAGCGYGAGSADVSDSRSI